MKRYKKYITPYLGAFLMGPLMMLTEVAGEVALPKLMSLIINNGVAGRDTGYILKTGLLKAAVNAQADGFVTAFKNGYHTEIGQGGAGVSGGQKQRLCIARALLKKPKILILDDSTSAVDTATEAAIRESFKNELKDTTRIIIAQRISSVQDADRILVLDDGKIIGSGTHEGLLRTCRAYEEIYATQIGENRAEEAEA